MMQKSESTKTIEWKLAVESGVVGERASDAQQQVTLDAATASSGRKRRDTTCGLLAGDGENASKQQSTSTSTFELEKQKSRSLGQVSISISVCSDQATPNNTNGFGSSQSISVSSSSSSSLYNNNEDNNLQPSSTPQTQHLTVTRKNKNIRPIDTSYRKSFGSDSSHSPYTSSPSHFTSSLSSLSPHTPATPASRGGYPFLGTSPNTPNSMPTTPISGYLNSYYDIAIPTTPIATPKISPVNPAVSTPFTTPLPDSEKHPSFLHRTIHNNQSDTIVTGHTQLFKSKYLLEFGNAELEEEYLAETRGLHIAQQR